MFGGKERKRGIQRMALIDKDLPYIFLLVVLISVLLMSGGSYTAYAEMIHWFQEDNVVKGTIWLIISFLVLVVWIVLGYQIYDVGFKKK